MESDATTESSGPVRLIIAEDHELARLGLRTMLAPEPDLTVVGEAATGRETLSLRLASPTPGRPGRPTIRIRSRWSLRSRPGIWAIG